MERHLRPETYVLMRWDDKKWTWTGRGGMVLADLLGQAYISKRAAWRAARQLHADEGGTIYVIAKKRRALIGRITGPSALDSDTDKDLEGATGHGPTDNRHACDGCGEEQAVSDLYPGGLDPGR